MSTTSTIQQDQKFYTVAQFSKALTQRGYEMSPQEVRKYVLLGRINGKRDVVRPKLWIISHNELERLVNQMEG